jgi:hypothetical protein
MILSAINFKNSSGFSEKFLLRFLKFGATRLKTYQISWKTANIGRRQNGVLGELD